MINKNCFRPHTWGCPFRTGFLWAVLDSVSVPIPGDVPSGQKYSSYQYVGKEFPSPYLGMSLPDATISIILKNI